MIGWALTKLLCHVSGPEPSVAITCLSLPFKEDVTASSSLDPLRNYQQTLDQMWWQTPVIPAFEGLMQRDCLELKTNLVYVSSLGHRVRPCNHRENGGEGWEEEGEEEKGQEGGGEEG